MADERRMLTARVSVNVIARIKEVSEQEKLTVSATVRLMLAYACRTMPAGWRG